MSDKLKTSGMLNLNFELRSQNHDSHFAFSQTILIRRIDSAFKYTQQRHIQDITLIFLRYSSLQESEKLNTINLLNSSFEFTLRMQESIFTFF